MGYSTTTSHQITHYYDYFRDKEIVFTKANLRSLKIDPRQIYVRCNGGQWPCIINSSSLQMAKIIIGTQSGAYAEMTKDKNITVSLKYCFIDQNNQPIHFFVNCTILDIKNYQNTNELAVVTLEFTQRPPDDLISRIGEFIEASENFINRKEERIVINSNSLRKLGMEKEESIVWIDNVPRRCILKDLSFSGAKIMLVGIPKFLVGKPINLKIDFYDTSESILVSGVIPRAEFLEGRQDISSVHISFNADTVPMTYKMHINSYITTFQKNFLQQDKPVQNEPEEKKIESAGNTEEQKKVAEEQKAAIMGNPVTAQTSAKPDTNTNQVQAESKPVETPKPVETLEDISLDADLPDLDIDEIGLP